MAIAVKAGTQTAADELRSLLAQNEDRLVKLGGQQAAADLFAGLDRLAELWPGIQQSGVDVRGEWTRWETLQAQLRQRGAKVLAAWGGAQALVAARAVAAPDPSHWWWWLDERVANRRRRRVIRAASLVAAVLVIAVVGVLLFERLFPVDENLRQAYRLRTDGETALMEGDYQTALSSIKQAASIMPDDPALQVLAGVLSEQAGDSAGADESWQTARGLLQGEEDEFLVLRAMAYGQVNQFDKSEQDALAASALNPNSARAYLYLGAAYEGQGRIPEAMDAYTKASDLAGDSDPNLTVLARARLASLLQKGPAMPMPTVEGP